MGAFQHPAAAGRQTTAINEGKPASCLLKALAYFDLFKHPLTAAEIKMFLEKDPGNGLFENALQELIAARRIFRFGEYYSLRNDPALVERRINGNMLADRLLAIAFKTSAFLAKFPYVRGIGISGSLSKNYADEYTDIDYFIITAPNRLWVARTLLHLFKKFTFLAGRQHWYCMNYLIDEEALTIEERNIFTAMEIVTLVPMYGHQAFQDFSAANQWTRRYFPHSKIQKSRGPSTAEPAVKRLAEAFFNYAWGERLDNFLMKLTARRWEKKERKQQLNIRGNRMGMRTGKHFSKPNPDFLQEEILRAYYSKLRELEIKRIVL